MKKYKILIPILMALLLTVGAEEFRKKADATIRSSVEEPIYAIADLECSVALSKGKHVIKLGPMFWGLYPGAIAFKTPEDALAYMKKKEMNEEESVIYRLSGNYKSDVNQERTPHHINKSLVMIEKLKYGSA